MTSLISLPDELRLHIYEYVFCEVSIKLGTPQQQRATRGTAKQDQEFRDAAASSKSTTFAIFTVSKGFATDPILHKALRAGATIVLTALDDVDILHHSLKPSQTTDIQHFSFEWKPKSVCPKGRTGKAIDDLVETLQSKFPATATLTLRTNPYEMYLQHPTLEDMLFMSEHAKTHGTSTRYTDDCGNSREIDRIVYDQFHCCTDCLQHHLNALQTGIEIRFRFQLRPGYSFGRPGMLGGPRQVTMSTRDYILRTQENGKSFLIPQKSFEAILHDIPTRDKESEFLYSFEKPREGPTRVLKTKAGTILRRYREDNAWRAG